MGPIGGPQWGASTVHTHNKYHCPSEWYIEWMEIGLVIRRLLMMLQWQRRLLLQWRLLQYMSAAVVVVVAAAVVEVAVYSADFCFFPTWKVIFLAGTCN